MGQASASSASSTGINAPGGSITKNSPGIWLGVLGGLGAIVLLFWLWLRSKKGS